MIEGWAQDRHFILFGDEEGNAATTRYGLLDSLPEYVIVGFLGWDLFIVRDNTNHLFTVPTVPAVATHLEAFQGELPGMLEPCDRAATIKWYVKPIVFGGDPTSENLIWVTHEQHAELVRWWNQQYRAAAHA